MQHRFTTQASFIVGVLSLVGCGSAHGAPPAQPHSAPSTQAERDAATTSLDQGHADAGSLAASADAAPEEPARSAHDASVESTEDAGSDAQSTTTGTPAEVQLHCKDGLPDAVPTGVELVASDIAEHLWTANAGVVSWFDGIDTTSPTLWQKSGAGTAERTPLMAAERLPDLIAQTVTIAADGGELFVQELQQGSSGSTVVLSRMSQGAAPFDLARESGINLGQLVVDDMAVYWLKVDGEQLSALSTKRDAVSTQDTQSLGAQPVMGWNDSASSAHVAGPVSIGDRLYVARSLRGQGLVLRAGKDGREPLSPFGPVLPAVSAMTSDGEALVLALEPEFDDLGHVHVPPRIVRLSTDGVLHEVVTIAAAGASSDVEGAQSIVVSGGRAYWNDKQQIPDWIGTLWSAPLDGSSAPVKALTTPGNLLSQELASDADAVFFALYCRVDLSDNQVTGRTHLLRLKR